MGWYVYIVQCADRSYYTGITTDIDRRIDEHNGAKTGARYTRAKRPVRLVFSREARDRSHASKLEVAIKKLSRRQKADLIQDLHLAEFGGLDKSGNI